MVKYREGIKIKEENRRESENDWEEVIFAKNYKRRSTHFQGSFCWFVYKQQNHFKKHLFVSIVFLRTLCTFYILSLSTPLITGILLPWTNGW